VVVVDLSAEAPNHATLTPPNSVIALATPPRNAAWTGPAIAAEVDRAMSSPLGIDSVPAAGGLHAAGGLDPQTVAMGAEALLREHPDALVCGLAGNGLIVPVPQSVGLWGQAAVEGRALIDGVVAADRQTVIDVWLRAMSQGAADGKVRLLDRPSRWVTLHFLDLRSSHDVLLGILIPAEETIGDEETEAEDLPPATPRFSTLTEDEGGNVLECDEAFTTMFGYAASDLIGKHVLDQIHPDDQGRAIEGWLAMLSTRRAQQARLRRRRKDGSWVWVDTTLHNYLNQPDRNYVLVEIIDISAEMHAQEALEEREELLRRITDAMPVGLLQLDTDSSVVYHNGRLLDILRGESAAGASERASAGALAPQSATPIPSASTLLASLSEDGAAAFDAALGEVLADGVDRDVEVDIVLPDGAWRRALASVRALLRPSGEVNGAITCVLDITDSARARQELERRATFDALTHCHNRSSILAALQVELERSDASTAGVVYVDLDKFKPVNDRLGHAAGDELLTLVAERLKVASRDEDLVGRLGGDEFLILLRDVADADSAVRVAQRICESLCAPFKLSSGTVELGASTGVACAKAQSMSAEDLVKLADAAMYESKDQGQCVPVVANPGSTPQHRAAVADRR
jgi:diguanylate cyclase (GGDEF)-like protein/PAS domain S-box-containing protein